MKIKLIIILTILTLLSFSNLSISSKTLNIKIEKKIALFYSEGFPFIDSPLIQLKKLKKALKGFTYDIFSTTKDLKKELTKKKYSLLFLPYGSAFPVSAWKAIFKFLKKGGNLVVLGGAPFHQPVWKDKITKKWIQGVRQPTYAHQLLIGPAEPLHISPNTLSKLHIKTYSNFHIIGKPELKPSTVYSLTVRFAAKREFENEDGSSGKYLASLHPLVHLLNNQGLPLYCPILEIDRLQGSETGGRWVFAPTDSKLSISLIRSCVKRALQGAISLEAYPIKASIKKNEIPKIQILLHHPGINQNKKKSPPVLINVSDKNKIVFSKKIQLQGKPPLFAKELSINTKHPFKPGLYKVEVSIPESSCFPSQIISGFLVKDEALLYSCPRLEVSKDWFRINGNVFPIMGTTYMCSNNHRKFLLYPNPFIWDSDFRIMKHYGINFIRTGIWTGWKLLITDKGKIDERILCALDAFVQTAAKHKIYVCFTFFAFLPPSFGGTNPYLDPISLERQKSFITQIAKRYRGVNWIHYDLINEPSYAPVQALWQTRPIQDKYEKAAWKKWLNRHHGKDPAVILSRLQEPHGNPYSLPKSKDFTYTRVKDLHCPRKAGDFILFTQEIFSEWAKQLKNTLKQAAGNILVTVGQDEGGTGKRPGQQFFFPSVDYTSIHTWWFNSDLLWDGIVTKVPEKPNLISETGIMRLEDINGIPWRTPEEAAALLERKFAYAFASKGAGVVQWIWNINPFQPIDNEAVIGIFRADGTAKPELNVIQKFSTFFKKAAPYLNDYEPDPVLLILPHSRLFFGRPFGMDATKRVVRILADHFNVFPTAISEYTLTQERIKRFKLLIVPVPEMLSDKATAIILNAAKNGKKVLITGGLFGNPYGGISKNQKKLGAAYSLSSLSFYEPTQWNLNSDSTSWAIFDKETTQFLRKGKTKKSSDFFAKSNIWLEPLPLEFSQEKRPLLALLKTTLSKAEIPFRFSETPIACRLLYSSKSILGICVNESSLKIKCPVFVKGKKIIIPVEPNRPRLFLIERATGNLLLITPGEPPKWEL